MKILFVTTISGFLKQFEMNDVKIMQQAGYEVHYASNLYNPVYRYDREELERQGIVFHHIDICKSPKELRKNCKALKQLKKIIREEKIDLIHCHNPMGGVIGRIAALGEAGRVTVMYTAHGFHFYKGAPLKNWLLYYPAEYLLARCTDRLITINEEDYQAAKHFRLKKNGKVYRIPGVGIECEKFRCGEDIREKTRRELGIPHSAFYILAVGELNDNKNHKVIIDALTKISDSNIYFGICGQGVLYEELERFIKERYLEKRVFLYGFREDIPRMLAAADCFVFPSKREGLGIAALEAMAAGIPMITSDCRGTREYMRHGENGYVCRHGSPEEYAEAICRMRDNPEERRKMSKACGDAAERFDISVTDRIMREIYREVW